MVDFLSFGAQLCRLICGHFYFAIPVFLSSRIYWKHKDVDFPCPPSLWFLAGNPSSRWPVPFFNLGFLIFLASFCLSCRPHIFQIQHIFVPDSSDPRGSWLSCKLNINNCSPSQIEVLEGIMLYEFCAIFCIIFLLYFAAIHDWKYHIQVIVIHCWSYLVISRKTRMWECL